MSVLIDAVCVVIPTLQLDVGYPGGAKAFLDDARSLEWKPRYALSDARLAVVSFMDAADAQRFAVAVALRANLLGVVDDEVQDVAYVEQGSGPTVHTPWLVWRVHAEGFTYASHIADPAPEDLIVPSDWTAAQSSRLVRRDRRDEPSMMKLAEEGNCEYWLDLSTGQQSVGIADGYAPHVSREREDGAERRELPPVVLKRLSSKRRVQAIEMAEELLGHCDGNFAAAIDEAQHRHDEGWKEGSVAFQGVARLAVKYLKWLQRITRGNSW